MQIHVYNKQQRRREDQLGTGRLLKNNKQTRKGQKSKKIKRKESKWTTEIRLFNNLIYLIADREQGPVSRKGPVHEQTSTE